jgi:hypothetical protein
MVLTVVAVAGLVLAAGLVKRKKDAWSCSSSWWRRRPGERDGR